jgi:hypothetical protein
MNDDHKSERRRRLLRADQDGIYLDSRLFWALLFLGSTAVMAVVCLSLAFQHDMPGFAVGVFVFWLVLFAGLAWFTRRMARWPR